MRRGREAFEVLIANCKIAKGEKDGAVVRSARDVRLPQVPEAPIGSHRQRLAPTRAAVSPVEDFERDSAERNTTFIAHTSPVHQDPLENWRDGTASALGHVPELGRTPD